MKKLMKTLLKPSRTKKNTFSKSAYEWGKTKEDKGRRSN